MRIRNLNTFVTKCTEQVVNWPTERAGGTESEVESTGYEVTAREYANNRK